MTCEIMVNGPHSYDVCVITHWKLGLSVIEDYDTPDAALDRHAEIVSGLRKVGWVRVSDAAAVDLAAA